MSLRFLTIAVHAQKLIATLEQTMSLEALSLVSQVQLFRCDAGVPTRAFSAPRDAVSDNGRKQISTKFGVMCANSSASVLRTSKANRERSRTGAVLVAGGQIDEIEDPSSSRDRMAETAWNSNWCQNEENSFRGRKWTRAVGSESLCDVSPTCLGFPADSGVCAKTPRRTLSYK